MLGGLGRLLKKRRSMQAAQGSAYGKAMNTQPQGPPTNSLSQGATANPQTGRVQAQINQQTQGGMDALKSDPRQQALEKRMLAKGMTPDQIKKANQVGVGNQMRRAGGQGGRRQAMPQEQGTRTNMELFRRGQEGGKEPSGSNQDATERRAQLIGRGSQGHREANARAQAAYQAGGKTKSLIPTKKPMGSNQANMKKRKPGMGGLLRGAMGGLSRGAMRK